MFNVPENGWKMYFLISLEVLMSIQMNYEHNLCNSTLSEIKWSKKANTNCTENVCSWFCVFASQGWKFISNLSLKTFKVFIIKLYTVPKKMSAKLSSETIS